MEIFKRQMSFYENGKIELYEIITDETFNRDYYQDDCDINFILLAKMKQEPYLKVKKLEDVTETHSIPIDDGNDKLFIEVTITEKKPKGDFITIPKSEYKNIINLEFKKVLYIYEIKHLNLKRMFYCANTFDFLRKMPRYTEKYIKDNNIKNVTAIEQFHDFNFIIKRKLK